MSAGGAVAGGTGLVLVPVLLVVVLGGGSQTCGPTGPLAAAGGPGVVASAEASAEAVPGANSVAVPVGPVAGYSGVQLTNAAHIMAAAEQLGLPLQAQVIGVMTAMGESGLRVLDRGDTVGPDSRGLFQQRDNGAWGSLADRMDPTTSSLNYFRALTAVPGWAGLEPTLAAHRTQRNDDPFHYVRWYEPAREVVAALAGVDLPPGVTGGASVCPAVAAPAGGVVTAGYGEPGPWGGHSNGRIPASALSPVPWGSGHALRSDATLALTALDNAYRAQFGRHLSLTSTYRDYARQVSLKAEKGSYAATPGTSNHGWGLAVDLGGGVNSYTSAQYAWMRANAPAYGWVNPTWAHRGGSGPDEPWHWEFYGVPDATV